MVLEEKAIVNQLTYADVTLLLYIYNVLCPNGLHTIVFCISFCNVCKGPTLLLHIYSRSSCQFGFRGAFINVVFNEFNVLVALEMILEIAIRQKMKLKFLSQIGVPGNGAG